MWGKKLTVFHFGEKGKRHTWIVRLVNIRDVDQSNGTWLVMEIIDLLDHLGHLAYYKTWQWNIIKQTMPICQK